jgi:hypothetical protein
MKKQTCILILCALLMMINVLNYSPVFADAQADGALFAVSNGKGEVNLLWIPPSAKSPQGGWRLEDDNGHVFAEKIVPMEEEAISGLSREDAAAVVKIMERLSTAASAMEQENADTALYVSALIDFRYAQALGLASTIRSLPAGPRSYRVTGLNKDGTPTGVTLRSHTVDSSVATSLPTPPSDLRAEAQKDLTALYWSPPPGDIKIPVFAYYVERDGKLQKNVFVTGKIRFLGAKWDRNRPAIVDADAPVEEELTYRVYSVDIFGRKGTPSSFSFFRPDLRALDPPINVKAEAGEGKITITWEPSGNPYTAAYIVERSYTNEGIYEVLTPKGLMRDTGSYEDKNVKGGTFYFYRVRAVGPRGDLGDPSQITMVTARSKEKPSKPSGLKADAGKTRVRLIWNAPKEPVAGYFIERRVEDSDKWLRINSTYSSDLLYDDYHAPDGYGTFSYRVVAVSHDYTESDPSGEVTATIEDRSFPPVPLITDIDGKEGKVAVTFQPGVPEENSHQFLIVRSVSVDDPGLVIGDPLPGKLRTFVDTFVKPGQFYWYRVVALDKKGNRSDLSSPVVVRAGAPLIPVPKKPEAEFLKEPFKRVEIRFEKPPAGFFVTVQHRIDGKDPWLTIMRSLSIDHALHTSLPEKGKVEYRIVYQASNGVQGEPSEPVEISIP